MYFAILGTFSDICLAEISLIQPKNLVVKDGVAFFDTYIGAIEKLSGIIKRGKVVHQDELYRYFTNIVLLGSNSQEVGMYIKAAGLVRRWKLIKDIRASDVELKKVGGREILLCDKKYCIVEGYQDIRHFEQIDFEKPASGMEIGMMPSKLAQMMTNIGVSKVAEHVNNVITIYDPFCGFGTTGFVVNRLGHNFIGSDINITPCKQNSKRRKEGVGQTFDKLFTVFKHDVCDIYTQKFLENVDCIVTEGRLGPVVRNFYQRETRKPEIFQQLNRVYIGFLKNYAMTFGGRHVPLVITFPVYQIDQSSIEEDLKKECASLGLLYTAIEQIYVRKGQNVGRKICVII